MKAWQAVRRAIRPAAKSVQAAVRWRRLDFHELPPIFGNAKPKSGSHLLLQVLGGVTRILPYRFVQADPIRTITKTGRRRPQAEILRDLRLLQAGVIGWGYLEATPENVAFLCAPGRVNYFIYRDPRDMLVSHVFFATDLHEEHGMHAYYQSLPDFDARLKVAIAGIDRDGVKMVDVRQRYEGVIEWLRQPTVLCVRFEDFLERRGATLGLMLDELERTGLKPRVSRETAIRTLSEAIRPQRSRTFRGGRAGDWRVHFKPEHKQLFKDVAGDLLVRLGYESTNDW